MRREQNPAGVAFASLGVQRPTAWSKSEPMPVGGCVRLHANRPGVVSASNEIEISTAAISGYGRLLRAVRRRIETHAFTDGGLICEDRTIRGRPNVWRILPDGVVVADSPYNFARGEFVTAGLPRGVSPHWVPAQTRTSPGQSR